MAQAIAADQPDLGAANRVTIVGVLWVEPLDGAVRGKSMEPDSAYAIVQPYTDRPDRIETATVVSKPCDAAEAFAELERRPNGYTVLRGQ